MATIAGYSVLQFFIVIAGRELVESFGRPASAVSTPGVQRVTWRSGAMRRMTRSDWISGA